MKCFLSFLLFFSSFVACDNIEKDWNETKKMDDINAYEIFREKHPESEFDSLANTRILELNENHDWESVLNVNKIERYEAFINKWPTSNNKEIAIDSIWSKIVIKDKKEMYANFIKNFPGNKYVNEAKKYYLFFDFMDSLLVFSINGKGAISEISGSSILKQGLRWGFPAGTSPSYYVSSSGQIIPDENCKIFVDFHSKNARIFGVVGKNGKLKKITKTMFKNGATILFASGDLFKHNGDEWILQNPLSN